MARKLYPPLISGTLPAFYSDGADSTLSVPFLMNKTVSRSEIKDMSLIMKDPNTDMPISENVLTDKSKKWTEREAFFPIPANLIVGQKYKVQIAYLGGYYSNVGIIKYTAKPKICITDFNTTTTNMTSGEYIGKYSNPDDPTEKEYQYKFTLFSEKGAEIETTGWQLHNVYEDTSLIESTDHYILKSDLTENETYRIQYSVITNNGLKVHSPKYRIMKPSSIGPNLNLKLMADLNYDNACVSLKIKSLDLVEKALTGAFVLSRASSDTNFKVWTKLKDYSLKGQLPSKMVYYDFAVEQGVTYRYSIQQYNASHIFSERVFAPDLKVEFEDLFLYDGQRQLRVRYNPKVSSFKTNVLDTKKVTIGKKHPFIFRNGAVAYKEFPIGGLISYDMDNEEFFLSRIEELGAPAHWNFITDPTDDNLTFERRFKLAVLDWLNDGKVKLFKSPTEGNYFVRLMNVSLTPIEQLGRMLHNFSCTASEIADFIPESLSRQGFVGNPEEERKGDVRWETIPFANSNGENLLAGMECKSIRITDAIPGTRFEIDGNDIMIGSTGYYEATFDEPIRSFKVLSPDKDLPGSINAGIYTTTENTFDVVQKISSYDKAITQFFISSENSLQNNLLTTFEDTNHTVTKIHFARYSAKPIQIVKDKQELDLKLLDSAYQFNSEILPYFVYFTSDTNKYYFIQKDASGKCVALEQKDYSPFITYTYPNQKNPTIISVEQDNDIYIPNLGEVPTSISIGNGVVAEIGVQIRETHYSAEEKPEIKRLKNLYDTAYLDWRASILGMIPAQVEDSSIETDALYKFDQDAFFLIPMEDRSKEIFPCWKNGPTSPVGNHSPEKYQKMLKAKEEYFTALDKQIKLDEEGLRQ